MKSFELLECLIEFSPGLIDGEEDDASGADVVDRIAWLLDQLDPEELEKLKLVAHGARKAMEHESDEE